MLFLMVFYISITEQNLQSTARCFSRNVFLCNCICWLFYFWQNTVLSIWYMIFFPQEFQAPSITDCRIKLYWMNVSLNKLRLWAGLYLEIKTHKNLWTSCFANISLPMKPKPWFGKLRCQKKKTHTCFELPPFLCWSVRRPIPQLRSLLHSRH